MTDREDCAPAILDTYITALLAEAASSYTSRTDIESRINAIQAGRAEHEQRGPAAADS